MRGKINFEELLYDVACRFGSSAEEWWRFAPTHLEAVWDYNAGVVSRCSWVCIWDCVTEIPCVSVADDHTPEAVLYVQFGEK